MTTSDMMHATQAAIAQGATCATCTAQRTCPWAGDQPCNGYEGR